MTHSSPSCFSIRLRAAAPRCMEEPRRHGAPGALRCRPSSLYAAPARGFGATPEPEYLAWHAARAQAVCA